MGLRVGGVMYEKIGLLEKQGVIGLQVNEKGRVVTGGWLRREGKRSIVKRGDIELVKKYLCELDLEIPSSLLESLSTKNQLKDEEILSEEKEEARMVGEGGHRAEGANLEMGDVQAAEWDRGIEGSSLDDVVEDWESGKRVGSNDVVRDQSKKRRAAWGALKQRSA